MKSNSKKIPIDYRAALNTLVRKMYEKRRENHLEIALIEKNKVIGELGIKIKQRRFLRRQNNILDDFETIIDKVVESVKNKKTVNEDYIRSIMTHLGSDKD